MEKVTREELKEMINNGEDVTKVNTSEITDMRHLFSFKLLFNQDISEWDVSNVTDMSWMFNEAHSFNQDISKWNVNNVTKMNYMFHNAHSFDQNISKWDVSNVKDMEFILLNAYKFDQDLSKWDVDDTIKILGLLKNRQKHMIKPHHHKICDREETPIKISSSLVKIPDSDRYIKLWDKDKMSEMIDYYNKNYHKLHFPHKK